MKVYAIVDMYNARRKDKAFANEVLDDVAEQLTKLLEDLGKDKMSFEALHISFEEKAFFDILESVAKKYNFYDEYIEKYGKESLVYKKAGYLRDGCYAISEGIHR